MTNKMKRKGTDWERGLAKILSEKLLGGKFKRIPGSGALGTIMSESRLTGDIVGSIPFLPKRIKIEAKTGYGGSKQLTIQREWLEKIREEADAAYALPALMCKFSGAKVGVKHFVVLDIDAFIEILNTGHKLQEDFIKLQEEYRTFPKEK